MQLRSLALVALVLASCVSAAPAPAPDYSLVKSVPLGSPDRWDYVVHDGATGRVYIAHGDRLAVIDARTGNLIGDVEGIPGGTHGTAISVPTHQGFTDDGRNGKVVAFNLDTLKVEREIPADLDADGIALDQVTGHVFVAEGDPAAVTVIDPKSDTPLKRSTRARRSNISSPTAWDRSTSRAKRTAISSRSTQRQTAYSPIGRHQVAQARMAWRSILALTAPSWAAPMLS